MDVLLLAILRTTTCDLDVSRRWSRIANEFNLTLHAVQMYAACLTPEQFEAAVEVDRALTSESEFQSSSSNGSRHRLSEPRRYR